MWQHTRHLVLLKDCLSEVKVGNALYSVKHVHITYTVYCTLKFILPHWTVTEHTNITEEEKKAIKQTLCHVMLDHFHLTTTSQVTW